MTDHATTGDGLMAGLQFLAEMVRLDKPASSLTHSFEWVPQRLVNVGYEAGAKPLDADEVRRAIEDAQRKLGNRGRLLIRPSGTEPKIRVMAEHEDEAVLEDVLASVSAAVRRVA